ncbi:MAG: HYR domain-containing protein [Saprospirales bacterium]|nr:MAG: HYR domain-containing protein [Saprospirales bacterium]
METKRNYTKTLPKTNFLCRWLWVLLLPMTMVSMAFGEGPEDASLLLPPQVEVVEIQDMVCPNVDNGFLHLVVTGGDPPYSVEWDFDGAEDPFSSFNPPSNDTLMFFFIGVGTLTVTISDNSGDESTFEYEFFEAPDFPEVIVHPSVVGCISGAVELDYDSNLVEILGGGLTDIDGPVADWHEMDSLPSGEYFLFLDYDVTAPSGFPGQSTEVNCQVEMPITIPEEVIEMSIESPDPFCLSDLEPLLFELDLSGGAAPYTVSITAVIGDSVITMEESGLPEGTSTIELELCDPGIDPYTCDGWGLGADHFVVFEVTDDNGCVGSTDTVDIPVEIIEMSVTGPDNICFGTICSEPLVLEVDLAGGTAPYTLLFEILLGDSVIIVIEDSVDNGIVTIDIELCDPGIDPFYTQWLDLQSGDNLLIEVEATGDNGCEGNPESLEIPVEIIHLDLVSIEPICIRTADSVCMEIFISGGQAPFKLEGSISICGEDIEVNKPGLSAGSNQICLPMPTLPEMCLDYDCSPCPCGFPDLCDPGTVCLPPCADICVTDDTECIGPCIDIEIPFSDTIGVNAGVSHPTDSTQNDSTITAGLTGLDDPSNVCLEKLDTASGEWVKVDSIIGLEPDSLRQATAIFEAVQPGTYRVVADDGGVCGSGVSGEVQIDVPTPSIQFDLEGIAPTDTNQSDGQIKITVQDGANDTFYVVVQADSVHLPPPWADTTFAGTVVADSMGCIFISGLNPFSYTIIISDPSGEKSDGSGSVIVPPYEEPEVIDFDLEGIAPTDTNQSDGQIKITIADGANDTFDIVVVQIDSLTGDTISIDTLIGVAADSMGCIVVSGLAPGTYEVEVSDPSGEKSPGTGTVEVPPYVEPIEIELEGISPTDTSQSDGQIKITVAEGANDTFDIVVVRIDSLTGDTISIDTLIGVAADSMGCIIISDLEPGTYEIEVLDPSGEKTSGSGSTEVPPFEPFVCDISVEIDCPSALICPDDEISLTLTANVSGGSGNYTLVWSTNESTHDIEIDEDGNYCVTVTDDADPNCQDTDCCEPVIDECPEIIASIANDTICPGDSDGELTALASGGCGNLTYSWDNGETTPTISGLDAGNYCVTITDDEGCEWTGCGEVIEADTEPPVAICKDITVDLDNSGEASIDPSDINDGSTDNCEIVSYDLDKSDFDCDDLGTQTVTLTVTDIVGLTDECTANVEVEDNIAPTIICPDDIEVPTDPGECDAFVNFVATADDNCEVASITYNPDIFFYEVGTTVVTVTATDGSGNTATCQVSVTVNDEEDPVITCPPNQTVNTDPGVCQAMVAIPPATAIDNCPGVVVTNDFNVGANASGNYSAGTTNVLFTAIDASGNTDNCMIMITVLDNEDPMAVCQNITVNLNPFGWIMVDAMQVDGGSTDNCGITSWVLDEDFFACVDIGPNLVTLTVSDAAGNEDDCIALITVEDNTNPLAFCVPSPLVLDLGGLDAITLLPDDIDAGSTDNCGIDAMTISPESFDCDSLEVLVGGIDVTLTVTDESGNSSQCVTEVHITDVTPPVANCRSAEVYLDEDGEAVLSPNAVDNGSTDNCDFSLSVWPSSFDCDNEGDTILVTLTAIDSSGNDDQCLTFVSVWDTLPPEILCPGDEFISVPAGQTSAFVDLDNATATDNCGVAGIVNDFNAGGADASDDYPLGTTSVVFTATDEAGNTGSCNALITVSDQPIYSISGEVATEDGTPVNEVFMNVTGTSDFTDTTNMDGEYEISVFPGDSVTVTPVKDTNYSDGVTTLSLINIQRHILLIQALGSPYRIIAADVNNNGVIATSDLISLQRVILNIDSQFVNSSWRFIKADYQFTDPTNPLAEDWPDYFTYPNVMQDYPDEDWIGIKIGDVVGNASGIRQISGKCDIKVQVEDRKDGTMDLVFRPQSDLSFTGYQFEFKFDNTKMELLDVVTDYSGLPNLNRDRFNMKPEEGQLRAIWYHYQDVSNGGDLELFRLRFRVNENVRPEDHFGLKYAGESWFSEVYSENGGKILEPSLVWSKQEVEEQFALYQNRPNPFSRETIIPFLLPNDMAVTLELTDVEGRLLKTIVIVGLKGMNEWRLSNDQLPEGVIFYRLITDQWTASRKMLKLR